jgi:hypothetical protein
MPDVRDLMLQWAERCVARSRRQRLIKRAPQPLGHSRVPAASPARAPLATGRRPLHSPQLINACAGAGAGASRLFSRWLQTHCRARDLTLSVSHAALLYGLAQAPLLLRLCARWTL